jgi:hypothetical protein
MISRIEFRTEQDRDVAQYTHEKDVQGEARAVPDLRSSGACGVLGHPVSWRQPICAFLHA